MGTIKYLPNTHHGYRDGSCVTTYPGLVNVTTLPWLEPYCVSLEDWEESRRWSELAV